jgi:cytoskeletal protein CcmA (bactofilin family)
MLDQRVDAGSSSVPGPVRQVRPETARPETAPKSSISAVSAQSTIGKSLIINGEITGSGSVLIEGTVEGSITLPDDRVTVGLGGRVSADISARDIVVLGEVLGNCNAADHLDIRRDGSLCGNVVVSRISVEEGAHLTGSIDIRREPAPAPRTQDQERVESLLVN